MSITDKRTKIYVAGHRGLVGSAIWRNLQQRGFVNLVGRTHGELDLTDQLAVRRFFDEERPEAVVLAAAFVGGIMANSLYRADFIMQNMQMQCNVISEAYRHGVKKLLFLGSTCIYPKNAPQPMKEDALLTSPLEYTNEPYAIAKIAGLKMCESYTRLLTMLYAVVMRFDSLCEIDAAMTAEVRKLHHKGIERVPRRCTLSDANVRRTESSLRTCTSTYTGQTRRSFRRTAVVMARRNG